jgi:hypothetical protein
MSVPGHLTDLRAQLTMSALRDKADIGIVAPTPRKLRMEAQSPVELNLLKQTWLILHCVQSPRVKKPQTGAYPEGAALGCKSLQPRILSKNAEFLRDFKGHFSIGNVTVRILQGQPGSHSTQDSTVENPESAGQMRPFASFCSVSILQNSTICERNRRKSLANT